MRESQFKVPTPDGKVIYGTLNRPVKETGRLIIMVHGLTSNRSTHPFPMAVESFIKAGYTVARYDQYNAGNKGRSILDCTTATFCKDLTTVIKHFKKPKEKIFLVGHSWGGLQIMRVNPAITAASLWDPSYALNECRIPSKTLEPIEKNRVLMHWGNAYAIGTKLNKELWELSRKECDTLARQAKFPIQVIQAGKDILAGLGCSYHNCAKTKTDFQVLKATHCFEELPEVPKLLTHTINWFNKF